MFNRFDLDLALALHRERIVAAQRQRLVTQARGAGKERKTGATCQRRASTAPSDGLTQNRRNTDLAHWLISVGDIVAHYPTAELNGHRRPALGVLVDELLNAARERGADVSSNTAAEDSAVVLLRTLGRLAASTAGKSVPLSPHRARILQTALEDLVNGHHVRATQSRAEQATDPNVEHTRSAGFTAATQQTLDRRTWDRVRSARRPVRNPVPRPLAQRCTACEPPSSIGRQAIRYSRTRPLTGRTSRARRACP